MFFWIYDHPTWAMALLFTFGFAGFGIAGLIVFRHLAHDWLHRDQRTNEMVGFAMSSFAMLYGLLLGLVAVAAYGSYSATSDQVVREASTLSALYRDTGGLPDPARSELQDLLRLYTREVIDVSWPSQRKGIVPTGASRMMTGIVERLQAFRPADLGEQTLHAEALRQANNLIEARGQRLANVDTGIPDVLWAVVLLGALINLVLVWMVSMSRHVHVVLTGLLAAFMGLVIFLIAALDYPFRGEVAVDAAPFEQVYRMIMAPAA